MKAAFVMDSTSRGSVLCAKSLEQVFASCFEERNNTRLLGGFNEPLYQPAQSRDDYNIICYREDFFASALHEVAHWCIAGEERRKLLDFGYWYTPDGRTEQQQKAFEDVEYQPQALEWFFAKACAYRFRVSTDNLSGATPNGGKCFEQRVVAQAQLWCSEGIPADGEIFCEALSREFGTPFNSSALCFSLAELDSNQVAE